MPPISLRSMRRSVNKVVNIDAFFLLTAVHKVNTEQLRFPPLYHANQKSDSKTWTTSGWYFGIHSAYIYQNLIGRMDASWSLSISRSLEPDSTNHSASQSKCFNQSIRGRRKVSRTPLVTSFRISFLHTLSIFPLLHSFPYLPIWPWSFSLTFFPSHPLNSTPFHCFALSL